jgi:regulator of RNase E activity RraB
MIDYYEMEDEEGNPYRCDVDLSLAENAPDEELPLLLWLFVKTSEPQQDAFLQFRDDLTQQLSEKLEAKYAGMIYRDGWSELYFYASSSKKFENIVTGVMASHSSYPHQMGSSRDAKWELYLEQLYPDPYAMLTMQNRHTIEALVEAGDDLSLAREIEHYLFFQTKSAMDRAVSQLASHAFEAKEYVTDDESDYAYGVVLIKTEPITPETVEETTISLYESAMQEHGHYEGWSTTLAK